LVEGPAAVEATAGLTAAVRRSGLLRHRGHRQTSGPVLTFVVVRGVRRSPELLRRLVSRCRWARPAEVALLRGDGAGEAAEPACRVCRKAAQRQLTSVWMQRRAGARNVVLWARARSHGHEGGLRFDHPRPVRPPQGTRDCVRGRRPRGTHRRPGSFVGTG